MIRGLIILLLSMLVAESAEAAAVRSILIDKSARTVTILDHSDKPRVLTGARFGSGWKDGPKRRRGDKRTPEGSYHVAEMRKDGTYKYLPALLLNYPNAMDRAISARNGWDPGDFILIHGPPGWMPIDMHPPGDWTDGCIALSRKQMRTLMSLAEEGMPVRIVP